MGDYDLAAQGLGLPPVRESSRSANGHPTNTVDVVACALQDVAGDGFSLRGALAALPGRLVLGHRPTAGAGLIEVAELSDDFKGAGPLDCDQITGPTKARLPLGSCAVGFRNPGVL